MGPNSPYVMTMESQAIWTSLVDSARELHIHDRVTDGNSMPEVVDQCGAEYKLQYADGDTMWIQEHMIGWDRTEGGWTIV